MAVVVYLMRVGADAATTDSDGLTALDVARARKRNGVVETLVPDHGKLEITPVQQGRRIVCTVAPK